MRGTLLAYDGTAADPLPPAPPGWALVLADDEIARVRAAELARASVALSDGTLGAPGDAVELDGSDALEPWTYRDELHDFGGLYRFFLYEHANGWGIGALRFTGEPSTLGQEGGDAGGCDPATDPNCGTTQKGGGQGEPCDPATDPNCGATEVGPTQGGGGTLPQQGGAQGEAGGGGGGGQTSGEPAPAADASCTWTPDASDSGIVGIANNISYHNSPVAWRDQGTYDTTSSNGTKYRLVMWWENGMKMVAAYRCNPRGSGGGQQPGPSKGGGVVQAGSSPWGVLVLLALVAGGGILASTGKLGKLGGKKGAHRHTRHAHRRAGEYGPALEARSPAATDHTTRNLAIGLGAAGAAALGAYALSSSSQAPASGPGGCTTLTDGTMPAITLSAKAATSRQFCPPSGWTVGAAAQTGTTDTTTVNVSSTSLGAGVVGGGTSQVTIQAVSANAPGNATVTVQWADAQGIRSRTSVIPVTVTA